MVRPKVFKTEKGKDGLSFDGFCYRLDQPGADGNTLYWRCIDKKSCKGRIATDARYRHPTIRKVHSYLPVVSKVKVREVRKKLRDRAATETLSLNAIYREEILPLANFPAAAAMMPPYASVSTSMKRDRRAALPDLPDTRADIDVPNALCVTTTGQQFVLFAGQNNDYIAFGTVENLRLCQTNWVSMDGTFDTAPRGAHGRVIFHQLFTIHCFEGENMFSEYSAVIIYCNHYCLVKDNVKNLR